MPDEDQPPFAGHASAKLSWDPAGGRANRMPSVPTPFDTLDTPFRIQRALEQSVLAASLIAVANAISAMVVFFSRTPPHTLLGSDPRVLASAQGCAALGAAYLAVRSRRQPGLGLATAILAWSIFEAVPWASLALYGHGITNRLYLPLVWLAVGAAVLGLRGALAQRRSPQQ